MPNIITHVLFARELKEKSLSDEQVQKVNFIKHCMKLVPMVLIFYTFMG